MSLKELEIALQKSQRYFAHECAAGVIEERTISEIYEILKGIVDALYCVERTAHEANNMA